MGALLGLALGGGGTRGIAHVGVLQALDAEGIRPDIITGTSSGGIAAAVYAAGVPLDEMERLVRGLRWQQLAEISLSRRGLVEAGRLRSHVDAIIEGRTFDQLRIPLGIVATDLMSGKTVVIRSGRVADAVQASCSIPGLFLPTRRGEHLLVDGGVTQNCPTRAAREMGAEVVVGVELHGWDVAVREPRHALRVVLRSLDIMLRAAAERDAMFADVMVRPRLMSYSNIDFSKPDQFIALGAEAAREAVPAIRAALAGRGAQTGGRGAGADGKRAGGGKRAAVPQTPPQTPATGTTP